MIFRITEKDLTTLGKAMEEALTHTDYNSHCFSSSDIRRAEAFSDDITRIFAMLHDNSINIVKDMGTEFAKKFKGYFNESDFEKIETPEKFETLLYSDAIWRVNNETCNKLCKLKESTDQILKVESKHYTKYWSALTHGSICIINPDVDSIVAFAETCDSLKKVLYLVLPEIENSEIKSIRAVHFDNSELELDIQYIKDSEEYSLYLFEDNRRADILVSSKGIPVIIYPTATYGKHSIMIEDDNFCNYYRKLQAEKDRLDKMVESIISEKLEVIREDAEKFSNLDHESLDRELYDYWKCLNRLETLNAEREALDEDSEELWCIEDEICYLDDERWELKDSIQRKIFCSISSKHFRDSLSKAESKYQYMISKEGGFNGNNFIDTMFNLLTKYYNIKVA